MKSEISPSDKVEIVAETKVKKQVTHIGSLRKIAGLTLYQFNVRTKELKKAEFVLQRAEYAKGGAIRRQVKLEADCVYIQALNEKNAKRKLKIK